MILGLKQIRYWTLSEYLTTDLFPSYILTGLDMISQTTKDKEGYSWFTTCASLLACMCERRQLIATGWSSYSIRPLPGFSRVMAVTQKTPQCFPRPAPCVLLWVWITGNCQVQVTIFVAVPLNLHFTFAQSGILSELGLFACVLSPIFLKDVYFTGKD